MWHIKMLIRPHDNCTGEPKGGRTPDAQRRAALHLGQLEVSHTRRAHSILINYLKCVVTVVSWYIQ